jgi:hypothetical protein
MLTGVANRKFGEHVASNSTCGGPMVLSCEEEIHGF